MELNEIVQSLVTIIVAIGASSGFWAYFTKRSEKKSATTKLLMGLAHDRIIELGLKYVYRGWISKDEYDDLMRYLYKPYKEFGGNGLVEKVIANINTLPLRRSRDFDEDQDE